MLFGAKDSFAIEAEVTARDAGWIFGRLRFWVYNNSYGDYENPVDLKASARWGRTFLAASSRRTRPEFENTPSDQVFYELYGKYLHTAAPPERWDRDAFVLDEFGESSLRDKISIVIVRLRDGIDRLLVRDLSSDSIKDFRLHSGQCDKLVNDYCNWVALECSNDM